MLRKMTVSEPIEPHDADRMDAERMLEVLPEVVVRTTTTGIILYVNQAATRLFGRTPEELVGTQALELFIGADREEAAAKLNGLERPGDTDRIVGRCRHADGTVFWVNGSGRVVIDSTGAKTVVSVVSHAGTMVETERALTRLEERFRELVEWLPAVVYEAEAGPEGRWFYVSPQIEQLLGYAPDEFLSDPLIWARRLHPDDRERVFALEVEQERQARETGARISADYRLLHRDGHPVLVRDMASYCVPAQGPPYWRGVIIDLTAEEAAQRTLREAHDRYRHVIDGLPACAYRAEPGMTTRWVFVSSQIQQLLGYTADEWVADPTLWMASLHTDDREMVEADETRLAEADAGTESVKEYRLRNRHGALVWVRDRCVVAEDADGRRVLDGILTDITAERTSADAVGATDALRLTCTSCGNAWVGEKLGPCPNCGAVNVQSVSLNSTLRDLAASRHQVEGLLDGIHRHLDALGSNLRSVSTQLALEAERASDPDSAVSPAKAEG
jgi:PAS domain S-box-containing protein